MSWKRLFRCDRCGDTGQHDIEPEYRESDLLPAGWERIAVYDCYLDVASGKDLCVVCTRLHTEFMQNK